MARDIDSGSDLYAATGRGYVEMFWCVDLDFSTPLYLWSGAYDRTIDSKAYIGAGDLLSIEGVQETGDLAARGAQITLSGVSGSAIAQALQETYQQSEGRVYVGSMADIDTSSPYLEIFRGRMDQLLIDEGAEASTVQVRLESKLKDLERPGVGRYTNAFQSRRFSGDKGLWFVESLQDQQLVWGSRAQYVDSRLSESGR